MTYIVCLISFLKNISFKDFEYYGFFISSLCCCKSDTLQNGQSSIGKLNIVGKRIY